MTTLTLCSPALPSARRQTRRLANSPQRLLPFPAPAARPASASPVTGSASGRTFAPTVDSSRNTTRGGDREGAALVLSTVPVRAAAVATELAPGARFARQRVAYAVETVGACIMLAGFLVLALFG
ncbi:MAG: hypothetical protein RLZZ562_256 [Planctomycetota bacterium]|jgi:hypothetical protein